MSPKEFFPKVREAREALREKALDILAKYESIIDLAIAKGEVEVAANHVQWLIEHMPAAPDGERMIDSSAAKVKEVSQSHGPTIQIGIALGDTKPKALSSSIVDAEVVKPDA